MLLVDAVFPPHRHQPLVSPPPARFDVLDGSRPIAAAHVKLTGASQDVIDLGVT